jgi:flagellar biosynthesis regulator FlbT
MEKQTSVEYFNQEIKELFSMHQDGEISDKMFVISRLVALTKAKQMEKQELEKFYNHGQWAIIDHGHGDTFEEYYNRTYGE